MADKPNLGRGVDKKPTVVERGHVVYVGQYDELNPGASGPDYSPVTGDAAESQKWINTPLKCDHGASHRLPPTKRVLQTGKEKPQNLCDFHYEKAEKAGIIDPSTATEITNDPEHIKRINSEDYQVRLGKQNRDAAEVFKSTGILRHVRTVGRPAIPNSDTQEALDRAYSGGGHIIPNHNEYLSKAYDALMYSKRENEDYPHYSTYAKKALSLGVPPAHVSKYYDFAAAHHKQLTGESAVPPVSTGEKVTRAKLIFAREDAPREDISSLMQSDIPAAVDEEGRSSMARRPLTD
jgi:hypothetical protein